MLSNSGFEGLHRRDFLRLATAGVTGVSLSGWLGVLANRAAAAPASKHKRCILLWMDGGPSHKDTFDMKPGTPDGGEFRPISTDVSGIEISEHFPKLAHHMRDVAIVRGMTSGEGAHGRARYYMHTGYREGSGGVVHPSLGAIVSAELGSTQSPLPNFVAISNRSFGSGFLGPKHQPLVVNDPARGVENLKPLVVEREFEGRVGLLMEMEQAFNREYKVDAGASHSTTYHRAVELMKSREAKAFDLSLEPASTRKRYGDGKFSEGCLLARRLVETGVSFVEVTLGGWDTHDNNFERVKNLSAQADAGMSALLGDLKQRGLLDSTLVIWMGEFGRTPKINTRGAKPGRDHYPRAWSLLMAGGGIKGGQVVGQTDKDGGTVVDRPVSALDFLATVCKTMGIDANKQNMTSIGRPIRIVDKGATPVKELLG
jgi:hypothetical protein